MAIQSDAPLSLTSCYIEKKSTFACANGEKVPLVREIYYE